MSYTTNRVFSCVSIAELTGDGRPAYNERYTQAIRFGRRPGIAVLGASAHFMRILKHALGRRIYRFPDV